MKNIECTCGAYNLPTNKNCFFCGTTLAEEKMPTIMPKDKPCPSCWWINSGLKQTCVNCGYNYTNSATVKPRTQKGIGLVVLYGVYPANTLGKVNVVHKPEHLENVAFPCFARPAPSEPKHGYIDSRVVKNKKEAEALLDQVLKDDPEGELLLCPKIAAKYNMIWTPTSIAIGPGHDGATSGKKAITIPLVGGMPKAFDSAVLQAARISGKQHPYVEAVMSKAFGLTLTQLRAGPKIELLGDYIPTETLVQEIIKADPAKFKDRDWEVLMEKLVSKPGVVVWHPGGVPTDHFSIHAFASKIPILFGNEKPKVGQVLQPSANSQVGLDPLAVLRGIAAGDKIKLTYGDNSNCGNAVALLLMATHNAMAMTGQHSRWLGVAAALMLRLGSTALRGESRHLKDSGKPTRDKVYDKVLAYNLSRHRACVSSLVSIFRYGRWPSSGFGGIKWACCGMATINLYQAVKELAVNPTEEKAANLVKALNMAVNQAHNGGWWLNKFAELTMFDNIPKAHVPEMLKASGMFYTADKIYKSLKEADFDASAARLASWPDTTAHPPRISSAKLIFQPGVRSFSLDLKTKLLGNKMRAITASLPASVPDLPIEAIKEGVYVLGTEDGYRVELRRDGDPVMLWQDDPLQDEAAKKSQEFVASKA